jgi:hypothetical protein
MQESTANGQCLFVTIVFDFIVWRRHARMANLALQLPAPCIGEVTGYIALTDLVELLWP